MRRLGLALIGFAIGGAFYLLLIDTPNVVEVYALAGVALLAGAGFVISREQGFPEATINPRWLSRSWRVVASVPVNVMLLCWDAAAQLLQRRRTRGVFRAVPFKAGGELPADVGRRALAEALGSIAPNTIVIGIDPDRDLLLVHQLHRQGGREQLDVLGLG
jgi:hypothetical protein